MDVRSHDHLDVVRNRTFDEIAIGDRCSIEADLIDRLKKRYADLLRYSRPRVSGTATRRGGESWPSTLR